MAKNQVEDSAEIETSEQGDVIGNSNNDRLAMLSAINDQNDQERAEEFMEFDDAGQVTKFVPNGVEGELPTGDEQDAEVTAQELNRMEDETADIEEALTPAPQKHKIKVNGKEQELSIEEIIAKAQKVEAADTYLAEAARIRKEAMEDQERVQRAPVPSKEDQLLQQQDEQRALVRAIQMGTEEEAMAAIAKLQKPAPPAFNADDLARTVDERLTFKSAVSKFESEYQDILSDPVLKNIAFQKEQELLAQDPRKDYWSRYDEVGKYVRSWRDNLVKANAPVGNEKPAVDPSKLIRKAATPQVPKAASVKVPVQVAEDDTDESPASVIANMAKSRGGPQWMRN